MNVNEGKILLTMARIGTPTGVPTLFRSTFHDNYSAGSYAYSLMDRLVTKGLVSCTGGKPEIYEITNSGVKVVEALRTLASFKPNVAKTKKNKKAA